MNLKKQEQKRGDGQEKIELAEQDPTLPTVACYRLTAIAAPLMNHLKAMMQVVQEQQEELKTVRSELQHYKVYPYYSILFGPNMYIYMYVGPFHSVSRVHFIDRTNVAKCKISFIDFLL